MSLGVTIERKARVGPHPFMDVFGGFEQVRAVRTIFGKETDEVLGDLSVEIARGRGYMRINDHRGSIVVNSKYLKVEWITDDAFERFLKNVGVKRKP